MPGSNAEKHKGKQKLLLLLLLLLTTAMCTGKSMKEYEYSHMLS